ncbi:MAG: methylated-DNA--[protein]-cysteine S-methyltransferase [Candidatus Tectimicrobiota bacterium]
MTCEDVLRMLEYMALPQARAGQYQPLAHHLQHCAGCQQRWQHWLSQEAQLKLFLTAIPAPVTLKDTIMRQLHCSPLQPEWDRFRHAYTLTCSAQGIRSLRLAAPGSPEPGSPEPATAAAPALLAQARQQLEEYFRGERVFFQLPLDVQHCTPFERQVLAVTATIPYGEVRSYRWLAERLGRPGAARAVGNALHRNPVPIFIPCHRIVKSDGSPGGYAFGPAWKHSLLHLEQHTSPVVGCSSTHILCYRGCHHERRVREGNRVHFTSVSAALELGYRPCSVCQPALQDA